MQKIITLFQRNQDGGFLVRDELTPGAEWVPAGEGVATVKYDGTCCLVRDGKLFRRYEVRCKPVYDGQDRVGWTAEKPFPEGFERVTEIDTNTGKIQGWVPVGNGPNDRWHREAFEREKNWADGTYELCGPKVQGGAEAMGSHHLIPHGHSRVLDFPRTFLEIRNVFAGPDWCHEGVVWHHPDGRMVKIKVRDFGLKRRFPTCE